MGTGLGGGGTQGSFPRETPLREKAKLVSHAQQEPHTGGAKHCTAKKNISENRKHLRETEFAVFLLGKLQSPPNFFRIQIWLKLGFFQKLAPLTLCFTPQALKVIV